MSTLCPVYRRNLFRLNVLLCTLAWLGGIWYLVHGGLAVKIPASFCFFLLGCVNTFCLWRSTAVRRPFVLAMLAGLLLGLAADIALELDFLGGAATFALGHICYLAAYCLLYPLKWRDMLLCSAVFLPCLGLILFLPVLEYGSSFMEGVVIVYALVICLMLGKALSNYLRSPAKLTKYLLLGSGLFFFSDFMLLFAFYSDAGRITNILCLNTYYPGQAILAASIFLCADSD